MNAGSIGKSIDSMGAVHKGSVSIPIYQVGGLPLAPVYSPLRIKISCKLPFTFKVTPIPRCSISGLNSVSFLL